MAKDGWDDAQVVEANWFKFNAVGDRIKGTLMSKSLQPGTDGFEDQWVYELRTEEGMQNVGISVTKKGTVQRLNSCKVGQIIGILFEKEGEPPKKGFHPPKYLKVVTFGMDPNYDEFDSGEEVEGVADPEYPPM